MVRDSGGSCRVRSHPIEVDRHQLKGEPMWRPGWRGRRVGRGFVGLVACGHAVGLPADRVADWADGYAGTLPCEPLPRNPAGADGIDGFRRLCPAERSAKCLDDAPSGVALQGC